MGREILVIGIATLLSLNLSGIALSELPVGHLVAHWPFDEGQGKSTDDVVNGLEGQIQDANWVDGKFGKALEFDGQASFVSVNDDPKLKDFPEGLTLEAWVMLKGAIGEFSVVVARKHPEYTLEVLQDSRARATVNGLWGDEWLAGKTALQSNLWYHLALTCDENKRRLYVSGEMETEKDGVVLNPSGDALGIGKNVTQDIYFFPGVIDEVKIWDVALTVEQIEESMEGGVKQDALAASGKLSITWGMIKN